ncbi:MAG: DNA alkylation repair protein [Bacteroidota bacterium]
MNLTQTLSQLEALGNETTRKHNLKFGAGNNQYGVKMGDIRALAKKLKTNHELAVELWQTGNIDARYLACLIVDQKKLSLAELETMVRSETFPHVADCLYANVIKTWPESESFRQKWVDSDDKMLARAGWGLTTGAVNRNPGALDLSALLDRLEKEMPLAPTEVQWTMNNTLAGIGINFAEHRERALTIGEKLGIYRDYPVSKGCTSPFAPIWITEMVKRQNN